MISTTNMGLTSWNNPLDNYNHTQLSQNWSAIDVHDHSTGKGVQINGATGIVPGSIPTSALAPSVTSVSGDLAGSLPGPSVVGLLGGSAAFNSAPRLSAAYTMPPDGTGTALVKRFLRNAARDNNPRRLSLFWKTRDTSATTDPASTVEIVVRTTGGPVGSMTRSLFTSGGSTAPSLTVLVAAGPQQIAPKLLGSEIVVSGTIQYQQVVVDIPGYQNVLVEVNYLAVDKTAQGVTGFTAGGQIAFDGTESANTGTPTTYNGTALTFSNPITVPSFTSNGNSSVTGTLGVTGAATVGSVSSSAGSFSGNLTTNGVFNASVNSQSVPTFGTGLAVTWNRSGSAGETVFWNCYTPAGQSFDFRQITGAGTSVSLMSVNASGTLTVNAITSNGITYSDATAPVQINTGTTNGTEFGSSASQKLSFYGATPIIQIGSSSQTRVNSASNVSSGTIPAALTSNSTVGDLIAHVSRLENALQTLGLLGTGGWSS